MLWPILGTLFFLTIIFTFFIFIVLWKKPSWWKKITFSYGIWLIGYWIFILFFCGPTNLEYYPKNTSSPYKLPWQGGVRRFVAQGNRSFTSHRDFHLYAYDFVMKNGTEILASRAGKIVEVIDDLDAIGFRGNLLLIEHEDGQRSGYAHIQYKSSLVKVGEEVKQGQPIALSGMTGQTIFPHVHFYVVGADGKSSIPISFQEIPEGVPLAGHFYTSGNY